MRITPENISNLDQFQIFTFGSNLSGIHGKGAAKTALKWGAKFGQATGLQGRTYAIPTKDLKIKTLKLNEIKPFVDDFILFAKNRQDLVFLVTEIGCGLAGYKPSDIAPLFRESINVQNIYLPKSFWEHLN
jgi:hypothetical protein